LFFLIFRCLIKANHSKGWDAKPPAYVARKRDTVAGLPGERRTFGSVLVVFRPNDSGRCDNEAERT
jgi:hypothetical protein